MLMVVVTMGIVMVVGTMNGGEIQKAPTADFTEAKMKPSNMQKMSAWLWGGWWRWLSSEWLQSMIMISYDDGDDDDDDVDDGDEDVGGDD